MKSISLPKKFCKSCEKELKLKSTRDIERKKFCSHACRQKWRYAQGEWTMDKIYKAAQFSDRSPKREIICEHCNNKFLPTSGGQRWCPTCCPNKSARARMQRYSISDSEWKEIDDKQKGLCLLCQKRQGACVDHDHETGAMRGLLCRTCNRNVWVLEREGSSGWIKKAVTYLNKEPIFKPLPYKIFSFKINRTRCDYCEKDFIANERKWCSECTNNGKNIRLLQKYNISYPDWKIIYTNQSGLCALCQYKEAVCVDHNHDTGEIRGLLCHSCNYDLHLWEKPEKQVWIERAIKYLSNPHSLY